MRKIIGIGETILDILFRDNTAATSVPGGSTFNAMISVGRAGVPACFVSEVGDDQVGHIVSDFLCRNGVDDRYLTRHPEKKSPIALAFLDEHNNATYAFYKEPWGKDADWECPAIECDDIVLFGSYYAVDPAMRHKVKALLDEARRVGAIVYYDVNFRRNHAGEAIKLMNAVIENLEYADIVRGSDEDFEVLYHITDGAKVFTDKVEFYCPRLVYSRGSQGVELYTHTFTKHYAAHPTEVVSTIGAGDNLNAGILYALIKYHIRRNDLPHLTEHDWDDIIRCGLQFSAETCQHTENYISREFAARIKGI